MAIVQQLSDLPGFYELVVDKKGSIRVSRESAMRLSAVYSCVNAISNDLAGLPVHIYQKNGNKIKKVKDHPSYEKVKLSPNQEMRAFDFFRIRRIHTLLSGNSYTLIERSNSTPVKNLWVLDPDEVTMERVTPSSGGRGRIRYRVADGISKPKYYNPESLMHLKAYTWDGLSGQSVLSNFAKQQIGIGLEMDEFQAAFFRNGLNPGGIFTHPKSLGEKKKPGFIDAIKKRFGGSKHRGLPMILEDGMEFKPYEVKMVDQQFMELLKLNKIDICGIFGVPQSRISIADSNTNYNNTEQEKRRYYESCLLPWAVPDEQEMTLRLLTPEDRKQGLYVKYNLSGFLRGDSKTRAEVSRIWSQMGVPVNDLLELEDRNPVDGGDIGLVQVNMAPIAEIGEIQKAKQTSFAPLFHEAFERVVNRENIALSKEIKKQMTGKSRVEFNEFLTGFYSDFYDFIKKNIRNTYLSYVQVKQKERLTAETDNKIHNIASIYIVDSKKQITEALNSGLDAVQAVVDGWRSTRVSREVVNILGKGHE